jgi:hypothetical protein
MVCFELDKGVMVGPIATGMKKEQIRKFLGKDFQTFRRAQKTGEPSDHFVHKGIIVSYKNGGVADSIEMAAPCLVTIGNRKVLGLPASQVLPMLQLLDGDLEIDQDGAISKKLGVAIYAPAINKNRNAKVESVFVFEDGHYD